MKKIDNIVEDEFWFFDEIFRDYNNGLISEVDKSELLSYIVAVRLTDEMNKINGNIKRG
jgi:hypothetical protein